MRKIAPVTWPKTRILLRTNSGFARDELLA
jgi:hypothetical protein